MRNRLVWSLLAAMLVTVPAVAAARQQVQVVFDIAREHKYYDVYQQTKTPADLEKLRKLMLASIFQVDEDAIATGIKPLPQLVGFVELIRGPADNVLRIEIADRDLVRSNGERPVYFRIALFTKGADGKLHAATAKPTFWPFRTQQEFANPVNDPEVFANEIKEDFWNISNSRSNEIVAEQLCVLTVADRAYCIRDRGEFILPVGEKELRVGSGTIFEVEADITDATGEDRGKYRASHAGQSGSLAPIPIMYQGKLRLRADQAIALQLKGLVKINPTSVHIMHYTAPPETPLASAAPFGGG